MSTSGCPPLPFGLLPTSCPRVIGLFFVHSSLSHVRPNIWLTSLLLSKIFSQIENIFGIFHVINFDLSTHTCSVSIHLMASKLIIFLFCSKYFHFLSWVQICFVWIIISANYILLSPRDLRTIYCLVIFSLLSCQKTWPNSFRVLLLLEDITWGT